MSKCPRCGHEEELGEIVYLERENRHLLRRILKHLGLENLPTQISFQEITMLPTAGGNTLVFTGTLTPSGSTFPADAAFTVSANDPAVVPTVDGTGLIVTVPLPTGWVEEVGQPLAISYSAASASNPTWTLAARVTPSAPVNLPTAISFTQTT